MMGERMGLVRYGRYRPPDFEPLRLPRFRRLKNGQQIKVRIMLPMSIRCDTCGNCIRQGTKLNSRKEEVVGETYLGIKRFRFHFKCTGCSAMLAIKTRPQDRDYVVESGAVRDFEPLTPRRDSEPRRKQEDVQDSEDEEDESSNRAIEKRTCSEEFLNKPTDSSTKATSSDISNDGGKLSGFMGPEREKIVVQFFLCANCCGK